MDGKRTIETRIPPEYAEVRLDLYLASRFTYRSRSQWQRAVEKGELAVNGLSVRPSRILHAGDVVAFYPDDALLKEPEVDLSYTLLADHGDFFAVSKPGNLPVHPSGRFFHHTLQSIVERDFGEVHLINRLDRETSGVTLFARDPVTAKNLSRLFEQRKTEKKYIAIVHGKFPDHEAEAKGFLGPDLKSPVNKKRRFVEKLPSSGAEEYETAHTFFRLLTCDSSYSIVEALPKTGRLHQIRATLHSLGFPMVGDKLYGVDDTIYLRYVKNELTDDDRERLVLPRQALHAAELKFMIPGGKNQFSAEAPLPEDISGLYQRIMNAIL